MMGRDADSKGGSQVKLNVLKEHNSVRFSWLVIPKFRFRRKSFSQGWGLVQNGEGISG